MSELPVKRSAAAAALTPSSADYRCASQPASICTSAPDSTASCGWPAVRSHVSNPIRGFETRLGSRRMSNLPSDRERIPDRTYFRRLTVASCCNSGTVHSASAPQQSHFKWKLTFEDGRGSELLRFAAAGHPSSSVRRWRWRFR